MRQLLSRGACAAVVSLLLVSVSFAQAAEKKSFERRSPVVEAVAKTRAGIVTIRVPRPGGGKDMIGSGVIVDERGVIVTNRHVVGANRNVAVRLFDGHELTGEVLVADQRWDLAIVRLQTKAKL